MDIFTDYMKECFANDYDEIESNSFLYIYNCYKIFHLQITLDEKLLTKNEFIHYLYNFNYKVLIGKNNKLYIMKLQ